MDEEIQRPSLIPSHEVTQDQPLPSDIQTELAEQPQQTDQTPLPAAPDQPEMPQQSTEATGLSPEDPLAEAVSLFRQTQAQEQIPTEEAQPQTPPIEATVEGDPGVIGTITDALKGLNNAPLSAINEAMDLSYSTGKFVADAAQAGYKAVEALVTTGSPTTAIDVFEKGWSKAQFVEQNAPLRFPEYKPETLVGGVTKGIAQWATGFLMTGLAGSALGAAGKATTSVGRYAASMGKGAAADAVFFDRAEERLSNFIEQFPSLRGPVTEFLAATPDDPVPLSMLKMALEGAGLGVATDTFVAGLKMLRLGRSATKNGGREYSAEVIEEFRKNGEELQQALNSNDLAIYRDTPDPHAAGHTTPEGGEAQALPEGKPQNTGHTASGNTSAKGPLTPDQLAPARDVLKIVQKAAKEEKPLSGVYEGINLNHEIFDKPGGSHVLHQLSELQVENTLKAAGPEKYSELVSNAVEEARQMGFTYDVQLGEGMEALKNIKQAEKTVLKVRAVMHNLSDAAMSLAEKINNGTASSLDAVRFVMLSKNMQEFVTLNADLRTVSGRLLGSRNITASDALAHKMGGSKDADEFLGKWLSAENMTEADAQEYLVRSGLSREMIMDVARHTLVSPNPASTVNVLKQMKPGFSFRDSAIELRVNGMLSGPVTHVVNTLGTGFNALVTKPLERFVGGVITADKQAIMSSWNLFRGMTGSVGTAWEMAGKALRLGDSILDRSGGRLEYQTHQLSYERIRNSLLKDKPEGSELSPMQDLLARSVGWLGTTTRVPTRFLVAEDEFFKQICFRGQLYADLADEAMQKGFKGKDAATYAKERMKDAFNADGTIAKNDLTKKALDFARDTSWTSDLPQGSFGRSIQTMANNHVAMKLLVPFIKTPMNLFYDAMRHSPTALASAEIRKAIRAGGEQRAEALGRLATGFTLMATGVLWAAEGRVTGAYPANPKMRDMWKENGIKPYSIKTGDKWFEYRRFDPMALILGVAADAYNYATEEQYDSTGALDDNPVLLKVLYGTSLAVINNLKDKTYVQGISDAIEAISDDSGNRLASFVNRTSTSFVPYSGLLRAHKNYMGDPQQRELDSWADHMRNTTSLFSKDLPPKVSWLTGEPVLYSGRITEDQKHDVVLEELLRLGPSVMGKPAKKIDGVDLTPEQYSRFCALHGGMRLPDGRNMRDVLNDVIHSEGYDLKRERLGDGVPGQKTPRSEAVNKVISTFRELAEAQLRREYPEINEKLKQAFITKKASKAGAMTKDNQSNLLDSLLSY